MTRGRLYKVIVENVAISAVQDLLQIKGATGKLVQIKSVRFFDVDTGGTLPTAQMLRFQMRFLPATVTDGSGGTSPTPAKMEQGDAAASFTAKANNTSQASTNGTAVVVAVMSCHIYAGLDIPVDVPPVGPSESMTWELLAAPSGTIHASIEALVEELGG